MEIKLVKQSSRSQKYRLSVPVEYFEKLGYVENDVLDVDIIVKNHEFSLPDAELASVGNDDCIKKEEELSSNNDIIIPYDKIIPMDSVLYVGKILYYAVNGKIVEQDRKNFEIDIKTGKIKSSAESTYAKHLAKVKSQNIPSAKFV